MGNEKNLIPNSERTPEELRAMTSKGGKRSGEVRRQRKAMKEQLEMLLKLPLKDKESQKLLKDLGFDSKDIDNQMLMTYALFQKAIKGDTKAYELIRDTIGEKPHENINIENPDVTKVLDSINDQLRGK